MKMKTTASRLLACAIIAFAFIAGCKKEEESVTTYQVINNCPFYDYVNFDGSIYEVIVYNYAGTEILKQDFITKISSAGGKSTVLTVSPGCDKIRFSFKFLPPSSPNFNSPNNIRYYIVASKRLEIGEKNIVTLTGNTLISPSQVIQGEETFFLIGNTNKLY